MGWDGKFRSFFILSPSLPLSLVVVLVPVLVVLVGIFFFSKGYRLEREEKREKKNRHSREEEEEEEEEEGVRLTLSGKKLPSPLPQIVHRDEREHGFPERDERTFSSSSSPPFHPNPHPNKGRRSRKFLHQVSFFFPSPPFPLLRSLITTTTRVSRSPIFLFPSGHAAMVL
jgi:hypothetical protein